MRTEEVPLVQLLESLINIWMQGKALPIELSLSIELIVFSSILGFFIK